MKLLGVNIGSDWEFNEYMLNICSKANRKPIVSGMFKYLAFEKKKIFLRTYFESQCKYYPLVWLFHVRQIKNRINFLHERAYRMIYNDSTSSFVSLSERDNSFSVHDCNIQLLVMKMYEVAYGLASRATSVLLLRK